MTKKQKPRKPSKPVRLVPRIVPQPEQAVVEAVQQRDVIANQFDKYAEKVAAAQPVPEPDPVFEQPIPIFPKEDITHYLDEPPRPKRSNVRYGWVAVAALIVVGWACYSLLNKPVPLSVPAPVAEAPIAPVEPPSVTETPEPVSPIPADEPAQAEPMPVPEPVQEPVMEHHHVKHHAKGKSERDAEYLNRLEVGRIKQFQRKHEPE